MLKDENFRLRVEVGIMEEECTYSDTKKDCNCILHCKKDDWYDLQEDGSKDWSKSKENVNIFWQIIQKKLFYINENEARVNENNQNPNREYSEYIDTEKPFTYEKIIFPCFQEESASKIGTNFYTTNFYEDEYEITIFQDKNLEFINCDFLGETAFKKYTFAKDIKFDNCNFYNNDIDFSDKVFNKSLFLKDCKNIGKLSLKNSTINGSVSFRGSTFGEVDFEKTSFKSVVVFNEATFNNDVDFKYTSFDDRMYFQGVAIHGKLNLASTIFKDEVNFLDIKNKDGKKLESDNIANRETARIIKHSFEKLNNIIEANKFYVLEMQKREYELSCTSKEKDWSDWIVFKFHKISSNHSQDWLLALLWIINLTLVYAAFQFAESIESHWLYLYSFFNIGFIIILIECLAYLEIQKSYKGLFFLIFIFLNWTIYGLITNDFQLCFASNIFNPLGKEPLSFGSLMYKFIIAYLIYQFIVSIRQNTRRK